jgi:type IV secretory pathway TraG/TraD family ATPase VirD4
METEETTAYGVLFVDELSAFEGDELASSMERARSAGVRVVVATQSLSNFDTVGGTKLLHAALDDTELLIIHCQSVPDAAEQLAAVGGTTEGWEHTHQVQDGGGFPALGIALGRDESGQRARRLTDRFIVHPNTIKRLVRGQAVVISKRPNHSVDVVQIRAGVTAR